MDNRARTLVWANVDEAHQAHLLRRPQRLDALEVEKFAQPVRAPGKNMHQDDDGLKMECAMYGCLAEEAQELGMDSPGQPVVRLPVHESVSGAEVYDDERWDLVEEQFQDSELLPYDIDFTVSRQDIAESLNSLYGDCNADVQQQMDDLADIINEDLRSRDALK